MANSQRIRGLPLIHLLTVLLFGCLLAAPTSSASAAGLLLIDPPVLDFGPVRGSTQYRDFSIQSTR